MNNNMRNVLREAWRIGARYWTSEEKVWAWTLLLVVVALNLGLVALNVRFNYWRNDFYNTIQNIDEDAFFHQLWIFSGLAMLFIAAATVNDVVNQFLRIRWRRWLTDRYLKTWLANRAYYRLQLTGGATDNPDQRIADDLRLFTDGTLDLTIGLMNNVVTLFSFLFILWSLSGPITIPLGSLGEFTIPSYLVWLALVYAVIGTIVTLKIGRPLVSLRFNQQRVEADFRYSLVRLRENTESVAFYRGEEREREILGGRFGRVFGNFVAIIWRQFKLNSFINTYGQVAVVFPYVLQAPRFFTKQIQLGDLMQTAEAFNQVQSALSFIVNSYDGIAQWQSVVQRLATFERHAGEIAAESAAPGRLTVAESGEGLAVDDLALDLPDGRPLLRGVDLNAAGGSATLITGRTGIGKSTVLRAIGGLWPFAGGRVRLPGGRAFFVPQKPYVPLGTLRQALAYPDNGGDIPDARLKAVLEKVGLGAYAGELDVTDNWTQRLSGGEQQRLAFARVFLAEPAVIFLDEATSALDEETEAAFYRMLREAPWHPTVVSIGHRTTLRHFHDRVLDLTDVGRGVAAAPAAG